MDFVKDILIPCLCVAAAAFAYSIIFHIKGFKLVIATIGGLLGWIVYLSFTGIFENDIPQYFISAVVVSIYCEIMARVTKTPVLVYLVIVILPLVPGGLLYYTMEAFIFGNGEDFLSKFMYSFGIAGVLALGVISVSTFARLITIGRKKYIVMIENIMKKRTYKQKNKTKSST